MSAETETLPIGRLELMFFQRISQRLVPLHYSPLLPSKVEGRVVPHSEGLCSQSLVLPSMSANRKMIRGDVVPIVDIVTRRHAVVNCSPAAANEPPPLWMNSAIGLA